MIALYRLYEVIDVEVEMSVLISSGTNVMVSGCIWLDVSPTAPSGNSLALLEGTDNKSF